MKKFYVFDFDGTLVDSMPTWSETMLDILNNAGVSYPSDIINTLTPLGSEGCYKYLCEVLGLKMTHQEFAETYLSYAIPKYRDKIKLKPGVFDCLKKLKSQGYSLNVLTASPHVTLDVCLINNDVYDLFDNVWSCDDFNRTKSEVKIYFDCAEKLNCNISDLIFVDDNVHALKTAKRAGVYSIGVHDNASNDYVDEIKKITDKYVLSLNQL